MKKVNKFILLFTILIVGCKSSEITTNNHIPANYKNIYLYLDPKVIEIKDPPTKTGWAYNYKETLSLSDYEYVEYITKILKDKGYTICINPTNSDMILKAKYNGNTSGCKIDITLLDTNTEDILFRNKSSNKLGFVSLYFSTRQAIKDSLKTIPNINES